MSGGKTQIQDLILEAAASGVGDGGGDSGKKVNVIEMVHKAFIYLEEVAVSLTVRTTANFVAPFFHS